MAWVACSRWPPADAGKERETGSWRGWPVRDGRRVRRGRSARRAHGVGGLFEMDGDRRCEGARDRLMAWVACSRWPPADAVKERETGSWRGWPVRDGRRLTL